MDMQTLSEISNNYGNLLNTVLLTVGLIFMFPKCKVPWWYAFLPFYRFYKLSQCADREEEGRSAVFCKAVVFILGTAGQFFINAGYEGSPLLAVLSVGVIVVGLAYEVHMIRIFLGLCETFSMKKKWVIVWIFAEWIPILLLGLSKKYVSSLEVRGRKRTGASANTEVIPEGLNVDIKKRTVGTFLHPHTLLRDIHLSIEPGTMVLLLGGSGAGKSTFVNALTGYEKADAKVMLMGKDVYRNYDEVKYDIGLAPQQELIRYSDTIFHTVDDAAMLRLPVDTSLSERLMRVEKVLDIFGLGKIKTHTVGQQSGGQKKRISIATEYIGNPFLFVLDEPDSGLDGVLARSLMQRLHDISREGKIVIVITHTPDRVVDLFDKIIVLAKDSRREGRLAFYGGVEEAREFFGKETMEEIVRSINLPEEGGEGRADELIAKFEEVRHEAE